MYQYIYIYIEQTNRALRTRTKIAAIKMIMYLLSSHGRNPKDAFVYDASLLVRKPARPRRRVPPESASPERIRLGPVPSLTPNSNQSPLQHQEGATAEPWQ